MEQTLVPTKHWLDGTADVSSNCIQVSGGSQTTGNCTVSYGGVQWFYPDYVYSYNHLTRPIKLTLSEIERLRKAAKGDDKLKAILSKFTDQIEIAVDFD